MSPKIVTCPGCGRKNRVPASAAGRPACAACSAALPWIVDARDADLAAALSTSQLVVIGLWAPWCGPCRMVAPVLERLASRYAGKVKVVKVNVDDNPASPAQLGVRGIPALFLFKDGQVVSNKIGAAPKAALQSWINSAL